jgi:hypothetical protein
MKTTKRLSEEKREVLPEEAIPEIWTACVQLKTRTQTFLANLGTEPVRKGDKLIVETENGPTIGTVATAWLFDPSDPIPGKMKTVLRRLTEEDLQIERENGEIETRPTVLPHLHREENLPMKLIEVEYLFDRSRLIFYFTAESRVDFRELVRTSSRNSRRGSNCARSGCGAKPSFGGDRNLRQEDLLHPFLNTFAPFPSRWPRNSRCC